MKNLLPIIVLVACAALGAGAGFGAKFLLPSAAPPDADLYDAATETVGSGDKNEKGHGKGHHDAPAAFVKFSRQFVVPAGAASHRGLVIIDLNIEVAPDAAQQAYALEPRLRDVCLSALLRLSAEGRLANIMTSAEEGAALKARLLDAVKSVIGEGALDVLITDIAMQGS
ncbi:MAG: flagellar basal body-associated FliL family protein [Parvularculaceae bacterium]